VERVKETEKRRFLNSVPSQSEPDENECLSGQKQTSHQDKPKPKTKTHAFLFNLFPQGNKSFLIVHRPGRWTISGKKKVRFAPSLTFFFTSF
jgi:hypothetical protein